MASIMISYMEKKLYRLQFLRNNKGGEFTVALFKQDPKYPLKVGLKFSINSFSMKVFCILYLHTEQLKSKRFVRKLNITKGCYFCISISCINR